jgi:hypothetical protein
MAACPRLDERRGRQWADAALARALCAELRDRPGIARALIVADMVDHDAAIAYEQPLEPAREPPSSLPLRPARVEATVRGCAPFGPQAD